MSAFTIEISDRPVIEAFNRLLAAGQDTTPAMRAISSLLARQTEDNFAAQSGPGGPWAALARSTIEGRVGGMAKGKRDTLKSGRISKGVANRAAGMKTLQDTGRLAASVRPFHSASEAGIGTNAIYAAIHQLGGTTRAHDIEPLYKKALAFGGGVFRRVHHPGSHIPARPYMPVFSDGRLQGGMEDEVIDILQRHLLG